MQSAGKIETKHEKKDRKNIFICTSMMLKIRGEGEKKRKRVMQAVTRNLIFTDRWVCIFRNKS